MTGKRPHDLDDEGDTKRVRSNDGSPAPPARQEISGTTDAAAAKKAAAQARIAALKAKISGTNPSTGSAVSRAPVPSPTTAPAPAAARNGAASSLDAQRAAAKRKGDEIMARIKAQRNGGATASPSANGARSPAPPKPAAEPPPPSEKDLRIAEARRKAAELASQRNSTPASPPPRQEARGARGGLGIGLHPSLMGDLGVPSRSKTQGPKFSTTKGNQAQAPVKTNPYLATNTAEDEAGSTPATHFDEAIYDPTISSRRGGERKSRDLVFNQKGKFIAQANALKRQAEVEEMKRRYAFEARKTEIEEAGDKAFLVPAPPDVEWWDAGILAEGATTYEGWETSNRVEHEGSIITAYIQHPILLQPPQEKLAPAPKPMPLTSKEQAKLRRQRRMADMKEEQAKVRLGLKDPAPPKVKKSNMMRVLGEQAVKDPTAVEARVNAEIAARKNTHEQANLNRKLTPEERAEKLKKQQEADAALGIHVAVFRVESLSSGKHRYQVDKNAKDHALTGIVVLHPSFNLIIVEGGSHSIAAYKKLLLSRIHWSENTLPLSSGANNSSTFTAGSSNFSTAANEARETWLNPVNEEGSLKDLSGNGCKLVWEGEARGRVFKAWGSKVCVSEGEVREVLRRSGMENMWTLGRSLGGGA
ncbi:hypothetical protein B0A48_05587 [Cryoendolithus antarcticus]|uniref:Uncharacterized protein n=1 Tax=Cryoendolithus antarcticus TaxID=1507870 RepID=A0A1V8TJA7_9PEZI|nr:hypothetical protein B0A48_05587 [Cryoendolithus antarcticus]